jgi:tetratricopeptide (TPR) repeat protein
MVLVAEQTTTEPIQAPYLMKPYCLNPIATFVFIVSLSLNTVLSAQEPSDVSSAPDEPSVHPGQAIISQAVAAFREGKGKEAMDLFVSAKKKHSDLPPGELMFAYLAFGSGQDEAGRRALEAAAFNYPDDPEPWNMVADLALRENRLAEASVLFEKSLALAEKFDENQTRKVKALTGAHSGTALVHERRQDWKSAERHLRAWIKIDKENSLPWQRLAAVFFATQRHELARKSLDKMHSLDETTPVPEIAMGLMYQQAGEAEKAEQSIRSALATNGDDFATQVTAAQWAMASGNVDLLKQCAGKAKELRPDADSVDALLGMAERFSGAPEKAEVIFANMLAKNPASFDAMNGVTLSWLAQDDANKHRKALQQAQVLAESNPDPRTARGRTAAATFAWALHRLNRHSDAEQIIQRVISSGDLSPEVGFYAASILHHAGQHMIAEQLLKAALDSLIAFPDRKLAEELMAKMKEE